MGGFSVVFLSRLFRFSHLSLAFYGLVAAPYDPGCYGALHQITYSLMSTGEVGMLWL